jgi:hypothetical protein
MAAEGQQVIKTMDDHELHWMSIIDLIKLSEQQLEMHPKTQKRFSDNADSFFESLEELSEGAASLSLDKEADKLREIIDEFEEKTISANKVTQGDEDDNQQE